MSTVAVIVAMVAALLGLALGLQWGRVDRQGLRDRADMLADSLVRARGAHERARNDAYRLTATVAHLRQECDRLARTADRYLIEDPTCPELDADYGVAAVVIPEYRQQQLGETQRMGVEQ